MLSLLYLDAIWVYFSYSVGVILWDECAVQVYNRACCQFPIGCWNLLILSSSICTGGIVSFSRVLFSENFKKIKTIVFISFIL